MNLRLLAVLALAGAAADPPPAVPSAVLVTTARGQASIRVAAPRGHAAIPVRPLARLLPLTADHDGAWATVRFAGRPYRFLLDAPALIDDGRLVPLVGGAYVEHDSLFIPLQWLTDVIPRRFHEAYRYDPLAARFDEAGLAPVVRTRSPATNASGLRHAHRVVVDPGHGGPDGGTVGRFLPRGVTEKDVTLAIGRLAREELERRGVTVTMTRSRDTLINLYDRAGYCGAECDLFVSIHVNSLNPTPGYQQVSGVSTYYLGEPLTAEARRVSALENDAVRYETGRPFNADDPRLFIFKDLQTNELLRESAVLAGFVQGEVARVHPTRSRGIEQSGLVVLRTATRPAVLVETGFATNQEDARFLATPRGQRRVAAAIADGVVEYLRRYEAKTERAN